MGTNNRERRRLKQSKRRKQQRDQGASRESGQGPRDLRGPLTPDEKVYELIMAATHAECEGCGVGLDRQILIEALADGLGSERGTTLVARRLDSLLRSDIAFVLDSGWTPDEVLRIVQRRATKAAALIMAGQLEAVATGRHPQNGGAEPEPWRAKGERKLDPGFPTWPSDLVAVIAALTVLEHLPKLPDLGGIGPQRRSIRSEEEERVFNRIRGLLAKAESSNFAEEADAFMAKAQELMTRHCIDRTMVDDEAAGDGPSRVEAYRVWLEDPYLEAKSYLLANVASANRCRAVVSTGLGFSTLIGHPDDLDATELLFTSLLVQATRRITDLGNDPKVGRRSRRPSYRRSFFLAYAERIGSRLRESSEAATVVADEALDNRLLPVLARREEEVDAAVGDLFDDLVEMKLSLSDIAGWVAGTAAADMAELAVHETLPSATVS
jgi:Protein of unknown function (DUF2786)